MGRLTEPFIEFFRYLPAPAFGALAVAVLGIEDAPKVAIIFVGTFPQQVLVISNATRRIDSASSKRRDPGRAAPVAHLACIVPGVTPASTRTCASCWAGLDLSDRRRADRRQLGDHLLHQPAGEISGLRTRVRLDLPHRAHRPRHGSRCWHRSVASCSHGCGRRVGDGSPRWSVCCAVAAGLHHRTSPTPRRRRHEASRGHDGGGDGIARPGSGRAGALRPSQAASRDSRRARALQDLHRARTPAVARALGHFVSVVRWGDRRHPRRRRRARPRCGRVSRPRGSAGVADRDRTERADQPVQPVRAGASTRGLFALATAGIGRRGLGLAHPTKHTAGTDISGFPGTKIYQAPQE